MNTAVKTPYQTIREIELADLPPFHAAETPVDSHWAVSTPLAGYIRETLNRWFDNYFYLPSIRELANFFDLPIMLVKEAFLDLKRQGFDSSFTNLDERILIWDSLLVD